MYSTPRRVALYLGVLTSAALLTPSTSCVSPGGGNDYYVLWLNKTGQQTENVGLYYAGKQVAFAGGIPKYGQAGFGEIADPLPPSPEVRWDDGEGRHHSVQAKVSGSHPLVLDQDWTVYFVMHADGTVESRALHQNDQAGRDKMDEGLRPSDEYSIGLVNKTGRSLDDIAVFYGDKQIGVAENLRPGGPDWSDVQYFQYLREPIPHGATLRWREGGSEKSAQVRLEGVVPAGYAKGAIYLRIQADGSVTVTPVKWGDEKGMRDATR